MVRGSHYVPPSSRERACLYGWFGIWDWVINQALRLSGTPRITVGPDEIAVDPHIHTMFSRCSISRPDLILLRAARLGLGAIAIMDHDGIRGYQETRECAEDFRRRGLIPEDFLVVPGIEVNSTAGHMGALFVTELPACKETPAEVVRRIHEAGGLAVAVHPYHSTGIGDGLFGIGVDAVETHCGSVFSLAQSLKNARLGDDARLASAAKLGSSDGHYLRAIGSCYSVAKVKERTVEGIRSAIESGDVRAVASAPYARVQRFLGRIPKLQ